MEIIMALFALVVFIMVVKGIISNILGVVFVVLAGISALCIKFARPVVKLTIKVKKRSETIHLEGDIQDVETELNANNSYATDINFAKFLQTDFIVLSHENSPEREIYDRMGNIQIHVKRSLFGRVRCEIQHEKRPLLNQYLIFSPSLHQRSNKLMAVLLSSFVIGFAVVFCLVFNDKYNANRENAHENLKHNIDSIVTGSAIDLKDAPSTDEKLYYSELPDVHLIVITKDKNIFVDPQSQFNNPDVINTVLMFYEDNLSGKRYQDETSTKKAEDSTIYYDMTELYLNLPLALPDGETCTIGEMFAGIVTYDEEIGYNAVKSWFRDIYHINVASVTEIPEKLFSGCFGSENSMSVNLNQDFTRFMYYQYCDDAEKRYASYSVKDMLNEQKPVFPETLSQHMEELTIRLGLRGNQSASTNAMLFMDGDSIQAFGNTVRMLNTSEYQYLRNKEYYLDPTKFPKEEWGFVELDTIVHSNWDIVMVDLLESISNMNNGTYQVFCRENHADTLSYVKTSLSENQFRQFLESLFNANSVFNENHNQQKNYVFYVRNLDLHVTTTLGKTNVYLTKKALKISPYTNRMVKKSLYYCLREVKK